MGATRAESQRRGGDHTEWHRHPARREVANRGTWQTQYTDGRADPEPDPTRLVVFVDLAPSEPRFYVVPRHEYEREVYLEHADYVRRYGERPRGGSKHHAVVTSSVEGW